MFEEKQTCPRRMSEFGPWERKENLDSWYKRGPDRVCSFCGSIHPDDFEKVIDRCLNEEGVTLDHSDKSYKVYIHRPEIQNAGQGAIKYYKQHTPGDPSWIERVDPKFSEALTKSRLAWQKIREQRG